MALDEKQAEKLRRSARKLARTDEALRTDRETPVVELATNYAKALKTHRKNTDEAVESA